MEIVLVGVNHKVAPVEVREHLAFTSEQRLPALVRLHDDVAEVVLLSTCNRTEVYAVAESADEGARCIVDFFSSFHGVPASRFSSYLYVRQGVDAARHLFSVASGLDSMILGEPQILGQVREAYDSAASANTTGAILSRLFHSAIRIGKQVRSDTSISRSAVSISYAAVELARSTLGKLEGRKVLLVGAGKMGELTARNLSGDKIAALLVANRTLARAEELANRIGGTPAELTNVVDLLADADVVITCTGAPSYVLTRSMVEEAIARRPERPLLIVDIAVPRDVEPEAACADGVHLHDVDDLQAMCAANLEERKREATVAGVMVDDEVEVFEAWWRSLRVVPTISDLRRRAEGIRQGELQKYMVRMGDLSDRQRSTLEALTQGIVNKMLHQPIVHLKERSSDDAGPEYTQAIRELFALDD